MNVQHAQLPFLPAHLVPAGAKTELATFSFPLGNLSHAARTILDYAIAHPWQVGIASALIFGGFLFLTLPIIVGFAETGPVAGTIAAQWQSWIGNVAARSLFSVIQSLVMRGVFRSVGLAMVQAGIAAGLIPPEYFETPVYRPEDPVRSAGWRARSEWVPHVAVVGAAYWGWRGF